MEKLVDSGKARSIGRSSSTSHTRGKITNSSLGLSNFNVLKTKRILEVARIVPAVNQVEIHPYVAPGVKSNCTCATSDRNPIQLLSTAAARRLLSQERHSCHGSPAAGRPVPVVRAHPDEPFPTDDPRVRELVGSSRLRPRFPVPPDFDSCKQIISIGGQCDMSPAQVCPHSLNVDHCTH